ncbi:NTP transferase domain-containing protein [Leucobacter manosquensis]|uniref:NTP transferase domain-containing protein n=1 Tax=Leucobacter manosquensis TaxID=2810611 RepID=A0ABS5M117_9MICO|nr:NTP transferase domain-containing protein [Leucobacter manosquensis]MBS3180723.1 NTP transferase domain-containing protein [Leucobacter manosquensis]
MVNASGGLGAIIFAGGRGSRLGGVDKATIELGGVRLIDRVVAAVRGIGVMRPVVVGATDATPRGCVAVREHPPYSGPLAALAAGLAAIDCSVDEVLLLACDLVRPDLVVARLRDHAPAGGEDATLLRDPDGRAQWLAGRYRVAALTRAIAALDGAVADEPLRRVTAALEIRWLDADASTVADIDTPADLARARSSPGSLAEASSAAPTGSASNTHGGTMSQSNHLPPEALDAWLAAAAAELDVGPETVRIGTVLDVARDVAHDVARPAAPLSTFLLGVAYGRSGEADPARLQSLAHQLTDRAAAWKADRTDSE